MQQQPQGRKGKASQKIIPRGPKAAQTQQVVKFVRQPAKGRSGGPKRYPSGLYSGPTVAAPVSMSTSRRMERARSKKSDRFSGCDLIGTISDTASFNVLKYAVNPGSIVTFPWLSVEASQWNEYTFHKLKFIFVSRCATSQVGTVILAPNYDASDPSPTLESQLGNYSDSVEDSEWKDIECTLDKQSMHPIGPRKFVRINAVAGDIKTYDVANLFLSTDGATTNVIGKLYAEYDVEFFDRIVVPLAAAPSQTSYFGSNTTPQTLTSTVNTTVAMPATTTNPLGIVNANGSFTPPSGAYIVNATIWAQDSASELFSAVLRIYKNGVDSVPTSYVESTSAATGSIENISLSTTDLVICSGTDVITVKVILAGTAGTLVIENAIVTFALA